MGSINIKPLVSYFAQNLIFLRKQKGLKHDEMARQLGIWENSLRQFELKREEPDLNGLIEISSALNLPVDHLLCRDLEGQQQRLRRQKIKLILLDIDGTLTDGGMFYAENGDEFKQFNVKDGMAIHRVIKNHKVEFGFVSAGSTQQLIQKRAEKLGISYVYAGTHPKVKVVEGWMGGAGISWKQIAYVGDDINDLEVMKKVGFSACPADAASSVKAACDLILSKGGGKGCIRELLEEVMGYEL